MSPRDIRTHFESAYGDGGDIQIRVQHVATTADECQVDPESGMGTAYVKVRSHDEARHILEEVGVGGSGSGDKSGAAEGGDGNSDAAGGGQQQQQQRTITIGDGDAMVGGIGVAGLHESNFLGDNKKVDRRQQQQQQQQQQQHGQGRGGHGYDHGGGGSYNDPYGNYDYDYGYDEQQSSSNNKYPPRDPEQEKRRREAREEARRRRQEEFEEIRRAKEERRAKIAEVKAEFDQKRRDLTSRVDNLSKVEGVTEKQLTLHKKMLSMLKDATTKAAKMREILDLQKKVNESKKEVIAIQAELEALDQEERARTKQIHIEHQQKQRQSKKQKYTLDKRTSTLCVSGFPFDCTFATDAVRKHFISALSSGGDDGDGDDDDAANGAIKSLEVEDDGQSVVIAFASRAYADKAKAGGAQYEGTDLVFKWRYGGTNSSEPGTDEGAEEVAEGEDEDHDEKYDAEDNAEEEGVYDGDDFGGGSDDGDVMIDYDMDEEEEEEGRWR